MSKAQLLKRMAEIRKKVDAEKATEKAGISKKDRNRFEALMAAERRFRALEKKGIDPADAKKYEGMTASDKKMFRDPDVLRDLGLKTKKPPSAGKIAKKVENKARKESSAVAKKASKEARKNLKNDLNYDKNVALKTKGAGAIGAAGVGGALYGRSKIKEAEKESEKRRANNKPTFEFKQLKKEPIKKKAGGALKAPTNPGLKKLPTKVRNKMGYMKSGGKVTSKCKRDGIAIRGRTKGRMV